MDMKKAGVVAGATFVLMIAAALIIYKANQSRSVLPVLAEVTPFELTERSGKPFGLEGMKGRISVVNFFFTNCEGPCPAMNGRVAELYRLYAESPQIQFVSLSIDPDRDSLAALQNYAKNFGVYDNRWLFLRGEAREIYRLAEKVFMVGGDSPTVHSTKLILVDEQGRIRGYYSSEEPASLTVLKTHIRELAKAIRS